MRIPYWLRPTYVWGEIRYVVRWRIPGYFQRANRGWAPHDTWSFDHYLALVIAEGLEYMASKAHGTPFFIIEECGFGMEEMTPEQDAIVLHAWKKWLHDKARWFRWYHAEEIGLRPGMTDEEKTHALDFWDKQEKHFNEVVLPDFWKKFGHLWD